MQFTNPIWIRKTRRMALFIKAVKRVITKSTWAEIRTAYASGIGLRSLQRLVREQLGLTPKWLIRRYRMQEAAAALADADAPALADLAASLGFADQAHLSREFRAVIGETPRRYAHAARAAHGPS